MIIFKPNILFTVEHGIDLQKDLQYTEGVISYLRQQNIPFLGINRLNNNSLSNYILINKSDREALRELLIVYPAVEYLDIDSNRGVTRKGRYGTESDSFVGEMRQTIFTRKDIFINTKYNYKYEII